MARWGRFSRRSKIKRAYASPSKFWRWRSLHARGPRRLRFSRPQRMGADQNL